MPSTAEPRRPRLIATSEGSSAHAFAPLDWGLLGAAALIWGSSFLLIAEGLESLEPGVVTFLRVLFGWLALGIVPSAPAAPTSPRRTGRASPLLGLVWLALPMTMFPIAEQWISSSVTGMLNGALPLFSAAIASILLRRLPGRRPTERHRRRVPRRRR